METVISPNKVKHHIVQKYQFKVLVADGADEKKEATQIENGKVQRYIFNELSTTGYHEEPDGSSGSIHEADGAEEAEVEESALDNTGMSDELLKRIESLSDELVKCQMALEKREKTFQEELDKERKEAYEEGRTAGLQEGKTECQTQLAAMQNQVQESIGALEESRRKFLEKVDVIEEELLETALDLAKQVIIKEVDSESEKIALRLARLLLNEIKEASDITLKVNPRDFDYLKTSLDHSTLKIVPDSAVSPGGVVIISDVGNIDGNIMHRFERIKEAVFGTGK